MLRAFILSIILLPMSVLATESRYINMETMDAIQMEKACRMEASEYSNFLTTNKTKNSIHPECRKFIESIATPSQRTQSKDGKFKVVAGLNIIYVDIEVTKNGKKVILNNIIAGPMTKIHEIESIIISQDSTQLAVIHKLLDNIKMKDKSADDQKQVVENQFYTLEKELLIFKSTRNGNVSPSKKLRNKEINEASSMTFHPLGKEIYLTNGINKQIISFSTKADYRYTHRKDKLPNVVRRFAPSEATFREPTSIDFMDGNILVLDSETNKVIALNPMTNSAEWAMEGQDIGLESASHLKYDKHEKKLVISDKKGNSVSFGQD